MTKKLCLALSAVLLLTSGLLANGLNLNGFGARAAAMGGAFVGLADDYTAVFWNPAGLALMKKGTFGLTGSFLMPSSSYALDTYSMKTESKTYPAGLLGFFTPIGDKVVVGLGAYTLSGLGADWKNTGLEEMLVYPTPTGAFTPPLGAYRWMSFIGSVTIAPSIAVKLSDKVFFGATFNINYGFFKIDQWGEYQVIAKPPIIFNFGQANMNVTGWGFGATFGLLVKPSDRVSFGLTYRLASKIKMSGTSSLENLPLLNGALPDTSPAKLTATSPMWLAGGLAVKPTEKLTITFDLQWTNWKKLDTLTVGLTDPTWNAFGVSENTLTLNWADKLQIRGGLEYKMGDFSVRAGYYYDPAPAPDSTMNILIPSFTYNSITAGFGYKKGHFGFDLGLEYLMGQSRTVAPYPPAPEIPQNMPGLYKMNIFVPMFSLVYGW